MVVRIGSPLVVLVRKKVLSLAHRMYMVYRQQYHKLQTNVTFPSKENAFWVLMTRMKLVVNLTMVTLIQGLKLDGEVTPVRVCISVNSCQILELVVMVNLFLVQQMGDEWDYSYCVTDLSVAVNDWAMVRMQSSRTIEIHGDRYQGMT